MSLRCAARATRSLGLCPARRVPWARGDLSRVVAREENVGSSQLVPAGTRPAWPRLHRGVPRELLPEEALGVTVSVRSGVGWMELTERKSVERRARRKRKRKVGREGRRRGEEGLAEALLM